ncbi:MAG: trypsin-like peptidase domain-containing protein [Bdellovibrionales bacterium]|jgi:V8-like Glu-specific endopeptidase|nr:trypsin-like peptidase domain-containing protein [Bdellovibrionales bacterium]MBT3526353.1 trypsin-like peptidase domain-containing protein [Bdellovibrionales bacterium]MBT7668555.1 trypsin-like peptidase domain-containing protein [Bdellovibrionales bacterium]MBT7766036.1 trypsin-like peptidase domain-containing protein [Bdellovibrionales bacterium]
MRVAAYLLLVVSMFHMGYSAADKVIYGPDNRYNMHDYPIAEFVTMASATAVLIEYFDLRPIDKNGYTLVYSPLRHQRGFCSDVPYLDQNSVGICTGFLIAPDILVTAGHCMERENSCQQNRWVFDYNQQFLVNHDVIPNSNVYSCTILDQVLDKQTGLDYAVVRLSRSVEDRQPLKIRPSGQLRSGIPLVVIGHPSGLPSKISDGSHVRSSDQKVYFTANMDTFGGNSGSPVINRNSGEVEGILVRGEEDYDYDRQRGCYINKLCEDDGCSGESATRIRMIKDLDKYLY